MPIAIVTVVFSLTKSLAKNTSASTPNAEKRLMSEISYLDIMKYITGVNLSDELLLTAERAL